MATYLKFDQFVEDEAEKVHDRHDQAAHRHNTPQRRRRCEGGGDHQNVDR